MPFADSISHLDGDEMDLKFLVVPRPQSSILYTVPRAWPELFLAEGDLLIVERDRAMRTGTLMLITVDGRLQLAPIRRERGRFVFDGMPEEDFDSEVDTVGVVTRVIRMLEGSAGVRGQENSLLGDS